MKRQSVDDLVYCYWDELGDINKEEKNNILNKNNDVHTTEKNSRE